MLTPPVAPPPTSTTTLAPEADGEITDSTSVVDSTTQDIFVTGLAVSIFESLLAIL